MVSHTLILKRGTTPRKFWMLAFSCLVMLLSARVPVWAIAPVTADGAKVYEENCASCHNGGVLRAPQLNVPRQKSAEDILDALRMAKSFGITTRTKSTKRSTG